ncbi:MAG TPA: hypothetical protein VIT91_05630 [Chthoniobacterales bacterium]
MPDTTINAGSGTGHPAAPGVPATKLLAIGRWTAKGTPIARGPILPFEMRDTARLYLAGKIDQWYFKTDESGVVLILNVIDPNEAHQLLEKASGGMPRLSTSATRALLSAPRASPSRLPTMKRGLLALRAMGAGLRYVGKYG